MNSDQKNHNSIWGTHNNRPINISTSFRNNSSAADALANNIPVNLRVGMQIKNIWEGKHGLYRKYTGMVTGVAMIQSVLWLSGEEQADHLRYLIVDWSDAQDGGITDENIEAASYYNLAISKSIPFLKYALVVPKQETPQALAALYEIHAEKLPWQTKVFNSLDEARHWIQQSPTIAL